MAKKILVVCRHFWPENYRVNDLCEKLKDRGFQVDVLCGQPSDRKGEILKSYRSYKVRKEQYQQINVYRSRDVKRGKGSSAQIFLNQIAFPLCSKAVRKKLANRKYDAILVYQLSPVLMGWPGLQLGKKLQIPVYFYVAELWPDQFYNEMDVQSELFKSFLDRLSMKLYQRADRLLVPSERMQQYLARRLKRPKEDFPVVPYSPAKEYEEEQHDDNLLEKFAGSFRILVPDVLDDMLSISALLTLAEQLKKGPAWNSRFIILGDSAKVQDLKRQVAEKNLRDRFYFEGYTAPQHIGKYLYTADVILAPVKPKQPIRYAAPQQIISYMAAGKPLVVSLSGMVKDLIKQAGCGFTSEPDDPETLYQNVMKLYRMSDDERLLLGLNAKRFQKLYFNRDNNADTVAALLEGRRLSGEEDERNVTGEIRSISEM